MKKKHSRKKERKKLINRVYKLFWGLFMPKSEEIA